MSTTDGGTTWQMDILDNYLPEMELQGLDFNVSGHGWATGVSGLTLKIFYPANIETTYTDSGLSIYPNPFTSTTTLSYALSEPSTLTISIFSPQGQLIERIEREQPKDEQQVQWNAEGLPAGMYYFRMQAGDKVGGGKMVLMR